MNCPICSGDAEDITPPGFNVVRAQCPECGEYVISYTLLANSRFQMLSPDERRTMLVRARALRDAHGGGRTVVSLACLPD